MKWQLACVGFQIEPIEIGGMDVWKLEWRPVKADPVMLPHPDYPQQIHRYFVYEIGGLAHPVRFAASELSNGVWGFYVPAESSS